MAGIIQVRILLDYVPILRNTHGEIEEMILKKRNRMSMKNVQKHGTYNRL